MEFVLVSNGKAAASIVLPPETEFDRFVEEKTPWLEQTLRRTHPNLGAGEFAKLLAKHRRSLRAEAKRAGDDEKLAAEELQSVIEKISGARLSIVRAEKFEVPEGPAILLGATLARRANLGRRLDKLADDGLICTVKGSSLILTGRRARGTLYAVYTFLESLGCRWVMAGSFGELYPSLKTISTTINRTENPSHTPRLWYSCEPASADLPRWTLRNKGNYVRALGDPEVRLEHILGGILNWGAKHEKYRARVKRKYPVRKWSEAESKLITVTVKKEIIGLPDEYYALEGGALYLNTPNMSNPRVWEMYADYCIDFFNENPLEQYVSLSAADGLVIDHRPESRELDSLEFDPFIAAPTATDRFWFFLDHVIKKVVKVHPDKKFGVLVFSNNMSPPRIEQVHPNMALVFAPLSICPLHHVRDRKCKSNRTYRKWLEDWMLMARSSGAETYYFDYEPLGFCWNSAMICPRWAIIGKNYSWFHKLGLTGHTDLGQDEWAACGLDNYVMMRLYWNADRDYKDIVADYARARFGGAAGSMIEYYEVLEKRMDEIPDLYDNEVWDNHMILTPEVRETCRTTLHKAKKLADTPRSRTHVQTMIDLQCSTDAMCDAVELADETADFGRAAKKMEKCFAVREKLSKFHPNFMCKRRLGKQPQPSWMTGGYYNLFRRCDKKIKGMAASLALPRYWKGMLDTRNHAWSLGYHNPEVSVQKLDDQDVCVSPDLKYKTQHEPAAFFYRTDLKVPNSFAGKKRMTLFFPGIIGRMLQIWVNGEPVVFKQAGFPSVTWRDEEFLANNYDHEREFDVTRHVKPGQQNTIVFRVFKSNRFGGTYRRVLLLAR
jgi:hypothetical protein